MKKFLLEILRFENLTWRHWLLISIVYLIVHIPVILSNSYDNNLAVYQAEAFLNAKLEISKYFWDASVFKGKYYVCFPPFPAIVMMPFVAVFGNMVNSILVSLLITCFTMYLFYTLLCRLMPDPGAKKWVFAAFFFGSGYWLAFATSDHINGFAHVVCTALLFLLLLELTGKQRPIWIGIIWSLAFLTRQMTIFYGFLIVYFLFFDNSDRKEAVKKILPVALTFISIALTYLAFNYYRFNNFFEPGYQYLQYQSAIGARVRQYGIFDIHYLPYNFYHMFIKGHNIIFSGVDQLGIKGMDLFGTSLLAASPFIIFSFKANADKGLKISLWITILSILTGILLYHNNGWMQVNAQRFSLDFLPALMVLIALSYENIPRWLFRSFTIYAVALNCLSFLIHGLR